MNKVILGLILAVCVLGMALVMLNERLGRKNDPFSAATAQTEMNQRDSSSMDSAKTAMPPEAVRAEEEARALAMELEEARQGLASPEEENKNILPPELPAALQPEMEKPLAQVEPTAPKTEIPADLEKMEKTPVPVARAKPAEQKSEQKTEQTQEQKGERTEKAEKPASGKVVNRFVVFARDGGATIRVGSPAKINFSNMTLENPDRVVVDMDGTWQFPVNPGIPKNEIVSKIRTGKMGDKTRVVVDLKMKPRSVRVIPARNGDGFDIRVDK